jgi:hypothetical protein
VDLALWEKAKRYRRIAVLASDEESARQTQPAIRLGGEKLDGERRDNHRGQTSIAG